jgi:hypothetical protein
LGNVTAAAPDLAHPKKKVAMTYAQAEAIVRKG